MKEISGIARGRNLLDIAIKILKLMQNLLDLKIPCSLKTLDFVQYLCIITKRNNEIEYCRIKYVILHTLRLREPEMINYPFVQPRKLNQASRAVVI